MESIVVSQMIVVVVVVRHHSMQSEYNDDKGVNRIRSYYISSGVASLVICFFYFCNLVDVEKVPNM
jgi:hypothetical protein